MNHLLRDLAPITASGWEQMDEESRQRLTPALAARKLVDFSGPAGWQHSSTDLGRTTIIDGPAEGMKVRQRRVLPLVELRVDFTVSREELLDADRGALDLDFDDLDAAAHKMALAENIAVFHGWESAGIVGIAEATPFEPVALDETYDAYPSHVARAVEVLHRSGIDGPYGIALGPAPYTGVIETTEHGGLTIFDHLREILGGPIVWAPGVHGAVVVSLRGGDFLFESGQDISIGYDHHDDTSVFLYLEQSFSFRVATPDAAVALTA